MNRLLSLLLLVVLTAAQFTLPVDAEAAVAASGTLNYTALGDSLAFGILDISGGGYVPRYGSYVQADAELRVAINNLGQNGWTSGQLLSALRTNTSFRTSIANSQIVTWNIGGNDFLHIASSYRSGTCGGADNQECLRATTATFKANWSAIVAEVLSLRSTSNTIIRTMDIYNPYAGQNGFQSLKLYLDDANNYIAATTSANHIPCAKAYQAFNGPDGKEDPNAKGYISSYDPAGVHPSDLGHKVIADLLRDFGYAPLTRQSPTGAPVLLLEENSNRTAAVDSVTLMRDPLPIFTTHNFSVDGRTRVTLFATNVTLLPGESASAITAQAEDSQSRSYPLAIEYVGRDPITASLTQLIINLPDELAGGGDLLISINLHGAISNKAIIRIKPSVGD